MSSDTTDEASELEDYDREMCIAEARRALKKQEFKATGTCHNCLDTVGPGAKYCNRECADDHEHRLRAERRRGRG